MRTLAWIALLVGMLACSKQGAPLRHPPQPPQAQGPATPQPAVPEPERSEPAAATEATDPGAESESEVGP